MCEGPNFPAVLPTLITGRFDPGRPVGRDVLSLGGFICVSLMPTDVEQLCMCLWAVCTYFPWRNICSDPCSFLNGAVFYDGAVRILRLLWKLHSYQIYDREYLLPFRAPSLPFPDGAL